MYAMQRTISFSFFMLSWLLGLIHAAKIQEDGNDIMAELRKRIKPQIDPSQPGLANYRRNFTRYDRETGEYTRLVYNCSIRADLFVSLDEPAFGVRQVSCTGSSVTVETNTAKGSHDLLAALISSKTGLLYGSDLWGCVSSR
jgi:hypothetical protein